jgi:LuxR family quorum-sensing system transcriptional regulator SolR
MMLRSPTPPYFPLSLNLSARAAARLDAADDEAPVDASACGLFSSFANLARDKGFPKLAYGVRLPLPLSHQKYMLFHYGLAGSDAAPCESVQLAEDDAPGDDAGESLKKILQSNGTQALAPGRSFDGEFAIAAPAQHFSGATGTLWLQPDTPTGRPASAPGQAPVCQLTVFALAHLIHASMTECLLRQYVPESLARITSREKEILRWTADGKTVGEISQIISISERTVKFHLHNIMNKLNAINKTQATVKAAALGMLRH